MYVIIVDDFKILEEKREKEVLISSPTGDPLTPIYDLATSFIN